MNKIEAFENIDRTKNLSEQGINGTLYHAYQSSLEAGNDLVNFDEVIWDYDIEEIIKGCKNYGITEFTISSTFSSLIPTLAEFEKRDCHMAGLTEVNARCTDYRTGEKQIIPAIRMLVKEA